MLRTYQIIPGREGNRDANSPSKTSICSVAANEVRHWGIGREQSRGDEGKTMVRRSRIGAKKAEAIGPLSKWLSKHLLGFS